MTRRTQRPPGLTSLLADCLVCYGCSIVAGADAAVGSQPEFSRKSCLSVDGVVKARKQVSSKVANAVVQWSCDFWNASIVLRSTLIHS